MKTSELKHFIKEVIRTLKEEKEETNKEYCAKQTCVKFSGCPTPCDCDGDDGEGKACKYNGDSPNSVHKSNSKAKKATKKLNEQPSPTRLGFRSCKCSDADTDGSCQNWYDNSSYGQSAPMGGAFDKKALVGNQTPFVGQTVHISGNVWHVIDMVNPSPTGQNQDYNTGNNPNCNFANVPGCTDSTAANYNPLATIDDGSCYAYVYGCMDTTAINYYPGAQGDDGTCCYVMYGCTDSHANNYTYPVACADDGSCDYEPEPHPVNPDIPPGGTTNCSDIVVQVTNALAPQTFECAQKTMPTGNTRFDSIDVGRCILIDSTGDIATILEINPGTPAHPIVLEMVPCPTSPAGPIPAPPIPPSQCSDLVVSSLGALATQQFECVLNNGVEFLPISIGKCVIIQGQQYKIEDVYQSTGTQPINGEIVQCSLAEGVISRMQKLANIKK